VSTLIAFWGTPSRARDRAHHRGRSQTPRRPPRHQREHKVARARQLLDACSTITAFARAAQSHARIVPQPSPSHGFRAVTAARSPPTPAPLHHHPAVRKPSQEKTLAGAEVSPWGRSVASPVSRLNRLTIADARAIAAQARVPQAPNAAYSFQRRQRAQIRNNGVEVLLRHVAVEYVTRHRRLEGMTITGYTLRECTFDFVIGPCPNTCCRV
jgi:hypothetical protein